MVLIPLGGPDLDDVDILLGLIQEDAAVIQGVAPLHIATAPQNFNQHSVAHGLPDRLQHRQGEFHAVFQAAPQIVSAEIGEGREKFHRQGAPIGHMDAHHIIVEHLQNPGLLHIGADDLIQGLPVVGVGQGVGVQPLDLKSLLLGHIKGLGHVSRVAVDTGRLLHLGPNGLHQGVAGGGALEDGHGGDGIMVMDDVRQLHQIVLAVAVIEIVVGKMAEIHVHRKLLSDGVVIDAHAGHLCRTPGLVGIVGDDTLRRIGLGALQEVGQRIGRDHAVFEHEPSHTKGGEQMLILGLGHIDSSCIRHFIFFH